jgi:hypothetical protein
MSEPNSLPLYLIFIYFPFFFTLVGSKMVAACNKLNSNMNDSLILGL